MHISLVAAVDEHRGIGVEGKIPWRLSSDLQRFKQLTMGHFIVMGRKTWESIGRPLPGRKSIVITHKPDYEAKGAEVFHSIEEALDYAARQGETEVFIIGGGEIFDQVLPMADRIYLTSVHTAVEQSDTFFPEIRGGNWSVLEEIVEPSNEENEFASTFQILERR